MKSAHEAAAKARAASEAHAASKAKAQANAPVQLDPPLVRTADGSMKDVNECIVVPPAACSPRAVKKRGGRGKKKHVPVTEQQLQLVINGGRGGNGPKLHDHGFSLTKDGRVFCPLCPTVIDNVKNVKRHTIESATHKAAFERKMDAAVKLHHQSIKLVDKKAKGGQMSDDLMSYRFKALISAAKHNVPTDAMKGICADFVDEYSGHTFADSSDAVSLAAGPLLEALVLRIRQILSSDGCFWCNL